jgi:hypothetical protein
MVVHQLDLWAEKGDKLDTRHLIELAGIGPFSKRDALNLNTVHETLEIRAFRSQKSAAELLKVMKLLAARIKYTNGLPSRSFGPEGIRLGRREKAAAFRAYVEEAGLDYGEYRDLAPRRFRLPKNCRDAFARLE